MDPNEIVAHGAAMMAWILSTEEEVPLVLNDATPLTLGYAKVDEIETGWFERLFIGRKYKEVLDPIVKRSSSIPLENKKVITLQNLAKGEPIIEVLEGEEELAEDNNVLEIIRLKNIRPATGGNIEIELRFAITAD